MPFVIRLPQLASVLLQQWNLSFLPTSSIFYPPPPLFKYIKMLRKGFLEYWYTSRSHFHRGLQESLGKAPSLLNNFRSLKHFSKTRELQLLICLVCSCVRIKGRHLHVFVSKSKDVSNEIVPDRGKICYSEASEINHTNPFLCHLSISLHSWHFGYVRFFTHGTYWLTRAKKIHHL